MKVQMKWLISGLSWKLYLCRCV